MLLSRGTPVIINDADAPEARLVAVLTRYDADRGIWFARYLSTWTNMLVCYTGDEPTPIARFGVRLEWKGESYRCVPTGEPSTAVYRDGVPRRWQERNPDKFWQSRARPRRTVCAVNQQDGMRP